MKSLTSLWSCMAEELAMRCCTSAVRDIKTVTDRTEHEGLSFLAITLADYGKVIEKWLDHGLVVPSDATFFKKSRLTGFPVFLSGFLGRVFDPSSGALLNEPDIEAIYALRQLTLSFGKIALPQEDLFGPSTRVVIHPRRERRAMLGFVQCEQDVRRSDLLLDQSEKADFKRIAGLLYEELFAKMDRDVHWARITPKHGPGAVADRLSSNAKWNQRTWTTRLQRSFPAEEFLIPNCSYKEQLREEVDILEPGAEIPVRVISVPKSLKTPRLIAIEPAHMQYVQQGLLRSFLDAKSQDGILDRMIGIDDQEPNRQMAFRGSLSGDLATLDLSEASDRVSYEHVRLLLEDYPELLWAVDSCRSRKAHVPGHGVIRLAKYASMGSALCFPFEAMVFLTLVFLGIERELSAPLSPRDIKSYVEQVRVFGDDIIVPVRHVLSVVNVLHDFGQVVNVGKSFWTGRFRESCGREYYAGEDVSIVRVRSMLPARRQDADGVNAAVSLRNRLYWGGLWRTAAWMDVYLRKLLKAFPNVAPSSPLLGRESALGYEFQKLHPNYQGPVTKGHYLVAKSPIDNLDGTGALLKVLVGKPWSPFGIPKAVLQPPVTVTQMVDGEEHLERSGRPERVSIKFGWRPPF